MLCEDGESNRHLPADGPGEKARSWALRLGEQHGFELGHALQDERLALQLFDELSRLGLLDRLDGNGALDRLSPLGARVILSCAALLHDIGYEHGYEGHHKHAFRMIVAARGTGAPDGAVTLIAHIARYHRGGLPNPVSHAAFGDLPDEEREVVTVLAALLRLADGLDRRHTSAVQAVECSLVPGQLTIILKPGVDDAMERWAGQKKARFLAGLLNLRISIR